MYKGVNPIVQILAKIHQKWIHQAESYHELHQNLKYNISYKNLKKIM